MDENIFLDMNLTIDGMGIVFYSDGAVKNISEGEDFFSREYEDEEKVAEHIKKGDIVGLEVNMRSPGGYTPDMNNYSKSVSTYKIWADVMTYNSTLQDLNKDKYFCVYYGRRDDKHYVMSTQDIRNKYWDKIKVTDRLPDVLSGAMGNDFFIANCSTKEEMEEFISDCSKQY